MSENRLDVKGAGGTYIVTEPDGPVIAAFYAESDPGWWRGHAHGKVRRLFLPRAEPLDVAQRFLRP